MRMGVGHTIALAPVGMTSTHSFSHAAFPALGIETRVSKCVRYGWPIVLPAVMQTWDTMGHRLLFV